jgi:uncharacterized protein (DUF362 family)
MIIQDINLPNRSKPKVFLSFLDKGYEYAFNEGLSWTKIADTIKSSDRITIKPNLTFPSYRRGVMTNPVGLESLVKHLKNYTNHITICESDSGGYNRFSMDEVFQRTGIQEFAKKYNISIVNLSFHKSHSITIPHGLKRLKIPLPSLLLDETDLFITMPVPKIHMNTRVSLSIKNQWGIIQIPSERLKLHPYFAKVVYAVNKAIPRAVSIIDGKYGLTRSGPLEGDVVSLNWIMISTDIFAADYTCCHLMGIDPFTVPYLKYCLKKEDIHDFSEIEINCDIKQFIAENKFYLNRKWTDYPGFFTFNSRFLAYIGYESCLAVPLHKLLYFFRKPFYDYRHPH